jgi:hypothetical protein
VVFFEPETSFTEHGWHRRGARLFFRDSGRDGGLIRIWFKPESGGRSEHSGLRASAL